MKKKIIMLVAFVLIIVAVFAGCKPAEDTATSGEDTKATKETESKTEEQGEEAEVFQSRTIKFLSIWDHEDPNSNAWLLNELSKEYAETVEGFSLEVEYVDITSIDQKVTILMSSNDLPEIVTYESGVRLKAVIDSGQIIDVDKTFTELGIRDCLDDGAVSLLTTLVDGKGLYDVPLGLNVEGYWYNKALFEQAGITKVPETWDEFMSVCDTLKSAGITPIVQGGADKWPMTRVLNSYVVRSIGLDALANAMSGEAHFTDPEYVAAAQMFADMASKEYFAVGMNTIDYGTAASMLMNGQAAILYNGSWFTGNLNNTEDNTAGPEGIGFFNVPLVDDSSTLGDYSMNCGNILMFSADKYDEAVGDWMKYVFPKLGDFAMQTQGSFKGFSISEMPEDTTYYTQLVADALKGATGSFLWFEAKMDSETSTLAQDNIASLYTGEMTPEEYMQQLEDSATRNR